MLIKNHSSSIKILLIKFSNCWSSELACPASPLSPWQNSSKSEIFIYSQNSFTKFSFFIVESSLSSLVLGQYFFASLAMFGGLSISTYFDGLEAGLTGVCKLVISDNTDFSSEVPDFWCS